MSERTAIVIQARTGSTRLPGKVLAPLAGASLLERVVERALAADAGDVVVATTTLAEDEDVRRICEKRGFRCVSGPPTNLLERHVEAARTVGADFIAKVPSDCPLVDPEVIRRVIGFAHEHAARYDAVSNLHPPSYPDGQDVEVFSKDLAEVALREASAPHEREHTTPFFWDRPERFRLANVAWERGVDWSRRHRWTVDYPEDYALVAAVYDALHSGRKTPFGIEAILAFLEEDPDVDSLNAHHRGNTWRKRLHEATGPAPAAPETSRASMVGSTR